MDAVMESILVEDGVVQLPDGSRTTWWKHPDVHWYIISGQHTVTACRELADQFPVDSEARKDLLEFEVIPVFSRDLQVLVRVSNALNLNIAEKVAKETFRSCTELGQAAWKRAGCPKPHKSGSKPPSAFEVINSLFCLSAASQYNLIATSLWIFIYGIGCQLTYISASGCHRLLIVIGCSAGCKGLSHGTLR